MAAGPLLVQVNDVEFRREPAPSDDAVPSGRPWRAGAPCGPVIEGALLEAALVGQCGGQAVLLLFLTDDVPFEDRLTIALIGADGELLDRAVIGGAYRTGTFGGLRIEAPDALIFRFSGDDDWRLTLLNEPQWRLPLPRDGGDPPGVARPSRLKRWFRLSAAPRRAA
jgi:hypothetical protein